MKTTKMSLASIKGKLSRAEMKKLWLEAIIHVMARSIANRIGFDLAALK